MNQYMLEITKYLGFTETVEVSAKDLYEAKQIAIEDSEYPVRDVREVTREYLVTYEFTSGRVKLVGVTNYSDGSQCYRNACTTKIETASEIFYNMAFSDCYDMEMKRIQLITVDGSLIPCRFYGKWHDTKDPLRMEIVPERGYRYDKEVGYAPNH